MHLRGAASACIAALLVGVTLGGCNSGGAADSTPSPSKSPSDSYLPPPEEDPTNPLLIAYCSMQDRVVTLEGQLLSEHIPLDGQLLRMRKAQRAAQVAADAFRDADKAQLARLAQRWADNFVLVRARLSRGASEIEAMTPAITALGRIERVLSCELDG